MRAAGKYHQASIVFDHQEQLVLEGVDLAVAAVFQEKEAVSPRNRMLPANLGDNKDARQDLRLLIDEVKSLRMLLKE